MKSFEDSSSYSDTGSIRNSLYSSSSFSQSSPPLSSTPTLGAPPINKPQQQPIRPKSRSNFSLNAQEFVPKTYAGYKNPIGATNDCKYNAHHDSRSNSGIGMNSTTHFPMNMTTSWNLLNNQNQNQLLMQRQQILQEKQLIQRQQELAAATIAKQQFLLSTTAAAKHPQDEIANSLKMFAFLSSYHANEVPQSPVDEVMQEFASNGYTTDDFNRYQQQCQAASSLQMLAKANIYANANNYDHNLNVFHQHGANNTNWQCSSQQQLFYDNEIFRQKILYLMRQTEMANAAAAAAAVAINIDYNRKTAQKPFKRNVYKKEVPVTAKRCVFCENNKEPEAVVKSHAVRDSHGRVLCPKLRVYVCPICGASGDEAHTVKYCPHKPIITMEDAIKAESIRLPHTGAYGAGGVAAFTTKQQIINSK